MAITLAFNTSGLDPRTTHFNVYRKLPTETLEVRIAQIPIQPEFTDLTGIIGSTYSYTFYDSVRLLESGHSPYIVATDSLDVVTITGFVTDISGSPTGKDIEVSIALQNLQVSMPVFSGTLITNLRQTVITDSTGKFVFTIIPNDLIYPGGTYYRINYLDRTFYKTVKSTDGAGQLVSSLLDVNPKELR